MHLDHHEGRLSAQVERWHRRTNESRDELFSMEKHDIRRSGVSLQLRDGSRPRISAEIGVILADALACKDIVRHRRHSRMQYSESCASSSVGDGGNYFNLLPSGRWSVSGSAVPVVGQ